MNSPAQYSSCRVYVRAQEWKPLDAFIIMVSSLFCPILSIVGYDVPSMKRIAVLTWLLRRSLLLHCVNAFVPAISFVRWNVLQWQYWKQKKANYLQTDVLHRRLILIVAAVDRIGGGQHRATGVEARVDAGLGDRHLQPIPRFFFLTDTRQPMTPVQRRSGALSCGFESRRRRTTRFSSAFRWVEHTLPCPVGRKFISPIATQFSCLLSDWTSFFLSYVRPSAPETAQL